MKQFKKEVSGHYLITSRSIQEREQLVKELLRRVHRMDGTPIHEIERVVNEYSLIDDSLQEGAPVMSSSLSNSTKSVVLIDVDNCLLYLTKNKWVTFLLFFEKTKKDKQFIFVSSNEQLNEVSLFNTGIAALLRRVHPFSLT